jgi:DNA-binding ferritin-like protein
MEICGGSMPTGNLPSALPTIRVIPMRAPESLKPLDMLAELRPDNASLTQTMRELHSLCDEAGDVATASLLENWIDESNERTWFLSECCCRL